MKIILSVLLLLFAIPVHAGFVNPINGLTGVTYIQQVPGTQFCIDNNGGFIKHYYMGTYATQAQALAAAQADQCGDAGCSTAVASRTDFVDLSILGQYRTYATICNLRYYGYPLSVDTDSDGVIDAFDACSSTSSGDPVDYLGCSCLQNGNCADKMHPLELVRNDNNELIYAKFIDEKGAISEYGDRGAVANCVSTNTDCAIITFQIGPNPDLWDWNTVFTVNDLTSQIEGLSLIDYETGLPININNGIPDNITQIAQGENNNTTNTTETDYLSDIVVNTQRNTDNQQEIVNQVTNQTQTLNNINNTLIQQMLADNEYKGPSAGAIGDAVGDQIEQKIGNVPVGYSDDPEAPIDDLENSVGTFVNNYMTTVKNLPILDALDSIQINTTAPVSSLTINNIFTDDPIVVDFAPYYSQIHSVGIFLLGFSSIYWFVYIFRGSW